MPSKIDWTRSRVRRRRYGLTSFPEEILQEILMRLPPMSVLRCRAVCRGWRRLTSDPAFLLANHSHQPTPNLISSFRSADRLFPDRLDAVDLQRGERRPDLWPPNCMFDASCDGLVAIGSYICNPATRQSAPLSQKVRVRNLVGLFRHPPSGDYRVLFWRISSVPSPMYCPNEYRVLTVGSGDDPRIISSPGPVEREVGGRTFDEPAIIQGRPVELDLINGKGPTFLGAPVLLHGNMYLHWKKHRRHKILVFDTVAESFRHMLPPAVNPCHIMQLFGMDGSLAASSSKDAVMELRIFMLQKESSKGDAWALQYSIKLPEMEIRRFQEQGHWFEKVVSEEGDLLATCFGWLLHCDREGNLVAKFQFDDDLPVVIPHVLKESLVQHAFFQQGSLC